MLAMLLLSSCGKNPASQLNKGSLPIPDATLTQSVPAKETWTEWGKRNWKYITATALYVAFTEWRIYKIHAKADTRNKNTKSRMATQSRKLSSVSIQANNAANAIAAQTQRVDS
jgi:hypothetical protein